MPGENNQASEVQERLKFLGLASAECERLRELRPTVAAAIEAGLGSFYDVVAKTPEVARFFPDGQRVDMAKGKQSEHWGNILNGRFDDAYVSSVRAIGHVHARIGLEPRWYIGGYALIIGKLIEAIVTEKSGRGLFRKSDPADLSNDISILVKAALLDMDFAISVYLDALAAERASAEAKRLDAEKDQDIALAQLAEALSALAEGDLLVRLPDNLPARFKPMAADFNAAIGKLSTTMRHVRESSESIRESSRSVSEGARLLAQRTESQAASIEESSAALQELSESVQSTSARTQSASGISNDALDVARRSGSVVEEAIVAMGGIENSSARIASFVSVIDEIAFQTNLLALNAGVEAARAGEAGRGFAVVAQEVRDLAQRSAGAAKEIKQIMALSTEKVHEGVQLVGRSGEALGDIVSRLEQVAEIIGSIAVAAGEQSVGLGEVSSAVNDMDAITQQNAGMVENTSGQMGKLALEVERLNKTLGAFRTDTSSHAPYPARKEVA